MKAFVLGGTGFVGRAVARRLAGSGWEVTVGSKETVAHARTHWQGASGDRELVVLYRRTR